MTFMLPATAASARSVVGVADDLISAIRGDASPLSQARSAVLLEIDGLGALSLRAHAGHARHLTASMGRKDTALSVFPTTTAAALTSTLTGVAPGEHGLVGYSVLDAERDRVVNLLSGWESDGIDPLAWQPAPTMFERYREGASFAVGLAPYRHSGFTRATLRGATFVAEKNAADRVARAYQLADENPGALVYCYLPDVDKAGHRYGIASREWVAALEDVDAASAARIPDGVGVLVTADHGMIDVPHHRQELLDDGDPRLDGVRHLGGEPRMLHVYLQPDAAAETILATWQRMTGASADIVTKADAIASGLFGPRVSDAAASRIGDLIVIARGNRAFYDARPADQHSRGMIGQHGAVTPEERMVPYLRWGAFAG